MSDDKRMFPVSDQANLPLPDEEGATKMFSLKLDSWLTDIASDLDAPAGAPPIAAVPIAAVAIAAVPIAAPPIAPPVDAAPLAFAPAPFADPSGPVARASQPDPSRVSQPDLAPAPPAAPAAGGSQAAPAAPPMPLPAAPEPAAGAVPAASAVPPIPSLAGSAVPPIPALAGSGPQFEAAPRRWPIVLAIVIALFAGGGAAAWFLFNAQVRALLKL